MDVILIAAISSNGLITRAAVEATDWSRDLALFKKQTTGFPVIMGHNTRNALPHELEGRDLIVIDRNLQPENILNSVTAPRCFVIGGSTIFSIFAEYLTHLYLTIHPLVFKEGLPLFKNLGKEMGLKYLKAVAVEGASNLYQLQFAVQKQ